MMIISGTGLCMTFGKSGIPGCGLEFMERLQVTSCNCVNISTSRFCTVACVLSYSELTLLIDADP
jgi:hypothetical protein